MNAEIQNFLDYYSRIYGSDTSHTEALAEIVNIYSCLGDNEKVFDLLTSAVPVPSDDYYRQIFVLANLLLISWQKLDIEECIRLFAANENLIDISVSDRNHRWIIYFNYLASLFRYYRDNQERFSKPSDKIIYVFGDSHTLSYSNLRLGDAVGRSELIMGIKMWHLGGLESGFFRTCIKERLSNLPRGSDVLFVMGEIDCRPDEGIWSVYKKGNRNISNIIEATVSGYIGWLSEHTKDLSVRVSGVPYPGYEAETEFVDMIKSVNSVLKQKTLENGWKFLDVFRETTEWHLDMDKNHLKPEFYQTVFNSMV